MNVINFFKETAKLNPDSIVDIRDKSFEIFSKVAGKKFDINTNLNLAIEELLVLLANEYGEESEVTITGIKHFEDIKFAFDISGEAKNPLESDDDEMKFSKILIERYCDSTTYKYEVKNHNNHIVMTVKKQPKKNKLLKQIGIAFVLAVITCVILKTISGGVSSEILDVLISPLFNKCTLIISAVATPLVFFAVIDGIIGVGSSSALGQMGKKYLGNMAITYGFSAVVFSLIGYIVYGLSSTTKSGGKNTLSQIFELVLDIIPDNLLECFVNDNDLQVIVIAIFVGVVLLMMGDRAKKINDAVSMLSELVNNMMAVICKILPFIVYLGVVKMGMTDTSNLSAVLTIAVAWLVSAILVVIFVIVRTRIIVKVSPAKLFKKQFPALAINLATSSQVAAMPEHMVCCKEKFGIQDQMVDFGLPLGMVIYMPCGSAFLGLLAWGLASMSGTPIDFAMLIKIAIVTTVVAIAAPPIPGSAFAVMPIVFGSVGIPVDYYSLAIILGATVGYFLPAFNGYTMQLDMLNTATQLDIVDRNKLLSN